MGVESTTGPPPAQSEAVLISEHAGDPDMQDIIEIFVGGMPARSTALNEAAERGDREALERLAHQLNGAAGGYGFGTISAAAQRLELAAGRRADLAELRRHTAEVADLCNRARAAPPARASASQGE
jgi:HPt (histidine-containing phosphotransfer) domain-containing protein